MSINNISFAESMENIANRLSTLENLYFSRKHQEEATSPSRRQTILFDLISNDTPLFLERYGTLLTHEELQNLETLNVAKSDYEINWHLSKLKSLMSPTTEDNKSRIVTVKNRRRAYLNRLILEGSYFSEEAMREREPYLHYEYVGKFQGDSGRGRVLAGESMSETLMRWSEEAILIGNIREEQMRLGVDQREWVGNERGVDEKVDGEGEEDEEDEEEKEEDEDEEEERNGLLPKGDVYSELAYTGSVTQPCAEPTISAAEMDDQMEQFTQVMHQKFLSGKDSQHLDYSDIDNDQTLDDHWLKEANHDAEEKYFAEE